MSVVWHSRQELGLVAPNLAHLTPRSQPYRGVVVHWIGGPETATPAVVWRRLQQEAMNGDNVNHTVYGDIEYEAGACESIAHPGNGSIFEGRSNGFVGAHATSTDNVANDTLLGIAVVGNVLTPGVIQALEAYIYCAIAGRDPRDTEQFVLECHRDLVNVGGIQTACPGDDIHAWVTAYRTQHNLATL